MLLCTTHGWSCPARPRSSVPFHQFVAGAEQRCKSLLLFSNVIFYFFVPLLLLLPSQRHGRQRGAHADADADADGERPHGSATALLNGWIERCLRPLMWPSKPRDGVQAGAAGEPPRPEPAWRPCINGPLERLVVCWGLLLLFVWAVCCLVHM